MKTVFILNPKAGKKKDIKKLISEIKLASDKLCKDTEVYVTQRPGDARDYAKAYCLKHGKARFIACGGDGTLGEIVNGIFGINGAEVGVMPMGTGNDFCRNFSSRSCFLDIEAQLMAKTEKCDVIRYASHTDESCIVNYGINMFNIGFDCNVADMTGNMKTKPFISGSLAYFLSIFVILIKKKGANLEIEMDGKSVYKGPLLLTSIANGSFCGGGVKSNPLASVNDGMMDVNIVNNVSRTEFISKLPYYMRGTHVKLKNIEKIITSHKCRKMTVTPLDGNMRLCVDGEICDAGKTEFEIIKDAIDFVVPYKK